MALSCILVRNDSMAVGVSHLMVPPGTLPLCAAGNIDSVSAHQEQWKGLEKGSGLWFLTA